MIQIEHLSKYYGQQAVLDDVSLRIETGCIMILHGPSGAGKTTLLMAIAGLIPIDKGEIYLNGELVSAPNRFVSAHQREIGFVFQSPALWPHMTVERNIRFGIERLPAADRQARVNLLLELMDMLPLAGRYPHEISGGEAQRVAIARALAPRPRYLLMDEPLTNLDPALHANLVELIMEYVGDTKSTVLYVTHNEEERSTISGMKVYLRDGKIERGHYN